MPMLVTKANQAQDPARDRQRPFRRISRSTNEQISRFCAPQLVHSERPDADHKAVTRAPHVGPATVPDDIPGSRPFRLPLR